MSSTGWGPAQVGLMLPHGSRRPAAGPILARDLRGQGQPAQSLPPPSLGGTAAGSALGKRAGTAKEEYFLKAKSHYILDSEDLIPTPEPSVEGTPELADLAPTWILPLTWLTLDLL